MNIENNAQNLSFYVAVIVYEFSSDAPNYQPLYQEDYILVQAASQEDAQQKTLQLAQKEQTTYKNGQGEDITFRLKHILDVAPVLSENLEHGADLYTRHFRNYDAYVAFEPFFSGGLE